MVRVSLVLLSLVFAATAQAAPWRVKSRIVSAERQSNTLRKLFERELDDYGWRKLQGAANAQLLVKRLDESLEALRIEADDRRPMRGRDRMVNVVARARAVDNVFRSNAPYALATRPRWRRLRTELDAIARIYELRPVTRR